MKSFRERRPTVVGMVSIVLIAAGLFGAFSINHFQGLRGVYEISADLRDAAGLQSGNEVRVAGVKVGKVTGIELTPDAARVAMEISSDVQLPVETRLEVKLKTLLGQKFIDLQYPKGFVAAASGNGDPSPATDGYLESGAVIPMSRTSVPFEMYQAANEGTAVLEGIDKPALRRMLNVLAKTVTGSKEELGEALVAVDDAMKVLAPKSKDISALLRNSKNVTQTLAEEDADIEGILSHGANVLDTLAERRETLSSLLAATNDLTLDLGLLIRSARGDVDAGVADLNTVLAAVEAETESLDAALAEFGTAQEMAGRPLRFGRFIEGHICAVTSEDTCVPEGSPTDPRLPVRNTQPPPSFRAGGQR
jgi:phospholipid/cholesterol/gamma-HCH transport system substrate-binding protein